MASMEANLRWALVTAVAPVAWGSTYFVTHEFLPAEHPLWGAVIRALPAGLLLLAVRRTLPARRVVVAGGGARRAQHGRVLRAVYVAAQLLPTSVAATDHGDRPGD